MSSSDADAYIVNILGLLFSLKSSWLIFPRYGTIEKFTSYHSIENSCAVDVNTADIQNLSDLLLSMQKNKTVFENDPYILGAFGEIMAAWDHHVLIDGFSILFSDIKKSTTFITDLNDLGAEFNVIAAPA